MNLLELRDKTIAASLWGIGGAWLCTMLPVLRAGMKLTSADRVDPITRVYCRGQVALTGARWRAEVDPAVRDNGVYLFVQNHVNLFDHVTMYPSTPHFKQGMELEKHFDIPFYGPFMKARGTIPVRRLERRWKRRIGDHMRREIAQGHSLLAFPEGTRTRTGRVGEFKLGIFELARELDLPVVPVAVTGMFDVLATPGWIIRPGGDVTVRVMAPVPWTGVSQDGLKDHVKAIEQSIRAVVEAPAAAKVSTATPHQEAAA